MFMNTNLNWRAIWVKRDDSPILPESVLRLRAGIDDATVVVETTAVGKWGVVTIPAGSRDEFGSVLSLMNVGHEVLPPEGRIFLLKEE
jgi:hypothetical protein